MSDLVACKAGKESLVRTLLRSGANAGAVNTKNWRTAIMLAAEGGHLEVIRLLLSIQEINLQDFGNLNSMAFQETART